MLLCCKNYIAGIRKCKDVKSIVHNIIVILSYSIAHKHCYIVFRLRIPNQIFTAEISHAVHSQLIERILIESPTLM